MGQTNIMKISSLAFLIGSAVSSDDKMNSQELESFESVNDDVMGGISSGSISACGNKACFQGTIRTENNGGFASIMKRFDNLDLSQYSNIKIKAQEKAASDESGCAMYSISMMDNADVSFFNPMGLMCRMSDGCYFLNSFQVCNEMDTVSVRFSDFDGPWIMGTKISSMFAWELDTTNIKKIMMFAMKPDIIGDFNLKIAFVDFE